MLDYVYEHHEIVAQFVAQMIPWCREQGLGKCKAIGVIKDRTLIAGIVYHNWKPWAGTIEITGAALPKSRWLTRETIWRMYEFPFAQLGCQMVVQNTPADNEQLLRQLAAGGYTLIREPRTFGRDHDGVHCQLTYETWLESKFIKRPTALEEAA